MYYNRFRYYSPDSGTYLSQDPIGLAGSNPNFYAYVSDSNSWVDVFGLDTRIVNPNDINYSQRTVSEIRVFDASKYEPIRVIEVEIVNPKAPHPDSTTGKTWEQKFKERFRDKRNKRAGGMVPDTGVKEKPKLSCKS